ncbi:MAG: biotin/lipoyl-binding protein, partial [Clostridiales bacterium]|nr:biotin/lipoyl-binding protein [Clostridiales bacterium]
MRISFHKQHGKREEAAGGAVATAQKKRRWPKRVIAIVLVVAIAGGGFWYFHRGNSAAPANTETQYMTEMVSRQDITQSLSGNGTLEAADSYSVTSLVEAEILTADFEEGDIVEKGDVLYELDSADASNSIENSEISLSGQQRNYENSL